MSKRRFTKGEPIRDIATLVTLLQANRWVYWGKAPKHPGFITSMQLGVVLRGLRGLVFYAIENTEGPPS